MSIRLILTPCEGWREDILKEFLISLRNQKLPYELYLFGEKPPPDLKNKWFKGGLEEVVRKAQRTLIFIDSNTILLPYALRKGEEALEDGAIAYGDYLIGGKIKSLLDDIGDITERFDMGPIRFYSIEKVRRAGGFNFSFKYGFEYDIRLRMQEKGERLIHLRLPLGIKLTPERDSEHPFRYLSYQPEEEREYEKIFKSMLRRRGAFLTSSSIRKPDLNIPSQLGISVIIPTYNRAKFLSYALMSLKNQTFKNFETIVVDNGSTDNTREIVENFPLPNLTYIRNPKGNIAYALNTGIRHAKGKYIARLDSDDELLPNALECMFEALEEDKEAGLAISYYIVVDEEGNPLKEFDVIKHLEFDRNNILRTEGAGALRVYRKSVFSHIGFFDEKNFGDFGEDYDMVLRVSEFFKVIRVHKLRYKYRRHKDSSVSNFGIQNQILRKNLIRKVALERRRRINLVQRMERALPPISTP